MSCSAFLTHIVSQFFLSLHLIVTVGRCDATSNLIYLAYVTFFVKCVSKMMMTPSNDFYFLQYGSCIHDFCFLIVSLSMPDLVLDSKKQRHLMKKMSQLIFYSVPFLSRFWRTKYYHLKNIFYCSWHCTCQPFIMSWHHILTPNL